jgi:dTDP-4-dehydrorhamnose reductase
VATFCITLAAREFGCVVVYSGSDSVFPGEREEPYHEFDPVGPPNSVYGYSKLAAENTIRQYLQKYFVLRLPWLFGRTGGPAKNWVVQLFQKVKAGQTVTAARDQLATVVYTVDVALAVRKMLETEFYGVYHIVSPGPVTRAGMHRHALEQAGYDLACLQEISINDLKRPAKRPHCNLLKSILLEPVFGIRIPPWEVRFDECISELKAAGFVCR